MEIRTFTFNPFMTNGYICHDAGEAIVVDPSCATSKEQQEMARFIESKDLTIRHLLLTHAHIDHIFGCHFFEQRTGDTFKAHRAAVPFMENAVEQAKAFNVSIQAPTPPETFLDEGDTVSFGSVTLEVLHTPGHSPDSICFVNRDEKVALTGDVLFRDSIGRIEGLPQTSYPQLMQSITETLLPLGDAMTIYPGHGPATTIGREREQNPFLNQ